MEIPYSTFIALPENESTRGEGGDRTMRRIVLSVALLLSGWTQADSLQAGVYNLDPPRKYPSDYVESHAPQPLELVTSYIFELRAIKDTPINLQQPPVRGSLRESYLKQLAQLEQKRNDGVLNV